MKRTLELAKLKDHPFSLVPGKRVTIWAGYEDVKTSLLDIIESPRTDRVGLYEFVVLHGELGSGKSHALRYLKYLISEEHSAEYQSLVVYLPTIKLEPKTDFMSIYRAVMKNIREHLKSIGQRLDSIIDDMIAKGWEALPEETKKVFGFNQVAYADQTRSQFYSELAPSFPPIVPLLLASRQEGSPALSILLGNRHGDQVRSFGLDSYIATEYDAIRCLGSLIGLITREIEGVDATPLYKCFYLFLDELEYVLDFPPAQGLSIDQGIRDLINACPEHFCLMMGATADLATLEALFDPHVVSRFSRDPLELPALDVDQGIGFIKEVLAYHRSDESVPAAYPYDDDALREIVERTTDKTARNLFKNCRIVLEKSVLSSHLESKGLIDVADVDEFLL